MVLLPEPVVPRMATSCATCAFAYAGGEKEILAELSFRADPGQLVAILGTTGSGKSTITNLIPRFYDVTAGRC